MFKQSMWLLLGLRFKDELIASVRGPASARLETGGRTPRACPGRFCPLGPTAGLCCFVRTWGPCLGVESPLPTVHGEEWAVHSADPRDPLQLADRGRCVSVQKTRVLQRASMQVSFRNQGKVRGTDFFKPPEPLFWTWRGVVTPLCSVTVIAAGTGLPGPLEEGRGRAQRVRFGGAGNSRTFWRAMDHAAAQGGRCRAGFFLAGLGPARLSVPVALSEAALQTGLDVGV